MIKQDSISCDTFKRFANPVGKLNSSLVYNLDSYTWVEAGTLVLSAQVDKGKFIVEPPSIYGAPPSYIPSTYQ